MNPICKGFGELGGRVSGGSNLAAADRRAAAAVDMFLKAYAP